MRAMRGRTHAAIAVLVTAVTAAGCGSGAGTTERTGGSTVPPPSVTSTSAPPSTTAAPAPSTTAPGVTPVPTTAASRLSTSSRLRIDGIGPISVGMSVAEARAAAGTELSLEKEPYCDVLTAPRGPAGVSLIVTDPASGRIDLIIVKESTVSTVSGIRVGSTEAQVLAAYPGRVRTVNPSLPVHRVIYEAADPALADRVLVFVIDGGRVATMYAGVRNQAEADEICG